MAIAERDNRSVGVAGKKLLADRADSSRRRRSLVKLSHAKPRVNSATFSVEVPSQSEVVQDE